MYLHYLKCFLDMAMPGLDGDSQEKIIHSRISGGMQSSFKSEPGHHDNNTGCC